VELTRVILADLLLVASGSGIGNPSPSKVLAVRLGSVFVFTSRYVSSTFLMLAVMSYAVWVFVAAIAGLVIGHLFANLLQYVFFLDRARRALLPSCVVPTRAAEPSHSGAGPSGAAAREPIAPPPPSCCPAPDPAAAAERVIEEQSPVAI
jgi:hypothetical protein